MNFKKILLSFLVAQSALFPFVVSMKTEALDTSTKVGLGVAAIAATGGTCWYLSTQPWVQKLFSDAKDGICNIPSWVWSGVTNTASNTASGAEDLMKKGCFAIGPCLWNAWLYTKEHPSKVTLMALVAYLAISKTYNKFYCEKLGKNMQLISKKMEEVIKSVEGELETSKGTTTEITVQKFQEQNIKNTANQITFLGIKDSKVQNFVNRFYKYFNDSLTKVQRTDTLKLNAIAALRKIKDDFDEYTRTPPKMKLFYFF